MRENFRRSVATDLRGLAARTSKKGLTFFSVLGNPGRNDGRSVPFRRDTRDARHVRAVRAKRSTPRTGCSTLRERCRRYSELWTRYYFFKSAETPDIRRVFLTLTARLRTRSSSDRDLDGFSVGSVRVSYGDLRFDFSAVFRRPRDKCTSIKRRRGKTQKSRGVLSRDMPCVRYGSVSEDRSSRARQRTCRMTPEQDRLRSACCR